MITIRNLVFDDIEALINLYEVFWGEKSNKEKMEKKFLELEKDNYIFLCAEKEDKIVGTIQGIICEELYGNCQPFLLMENFIVDKEYRGLGIGRKLIKSLEEIAKNKNCSQILFITESNREDAIKFYESVGYSSTTHKGFKKAL